MSEAIQFNIDDYPDARRTMICRSEYEAEVFLRYLDSIGRKWNNGQSYLERSYFPKRSGHQMIGYLFNTGMYSVGDSMTAAILNGSALYFSDFFWDGSLENIDPRDTEELNSFLEQFEVK